MSPKSLILLRHAKAENGMSGQDFDRPLAERGRSDVQQAATWLSSLAVPCDKAYYSAARRTAQTWQQLTTHWSGAPYGEAIDCLYLASAGDLLSWINAQSDALSAVMLIGHNPGLQQLALTLIKPFERSACEELETSFPTCACLRLETSAPVSWADIGPQSMVCRAMWTPQTGALTCSYS